MNSIVRTFCIATAALCALAAPARAVPTLYAANGHYYEHIGAVGSWATANAAASSMSFMGVTGHLATVTDAGENGFLLGSFGGGPGFAAWLGGFQLPGSTEPDGGWTWVTGETWSFTAWNGGEPNNSGGAENHLHYLGGGWNDFPGGTFTGTGYIVEYDVTAVPAPATALLFAPALALMALRRRRARS